MVALKRFLFTLILLPLLIILNTDIARADADSQFNWFWMFYEYEKIPRMESTVYVRPFFVRNVYRNNKVFEASLLPLYWRNISARMDEKKYLLGLWSSVRYIHPGNIEDTDVFLFPLAYGESSDTRDRYFFLWPFGGTLKGKLGQDRITFYGFPWVLLFLIYPPTFPPTWTMVGIFIVSLLPLYADYEHKDYDAWTVLWPLIQRGKSPTRDDRRFLPFFARNTKEGFYDNRNYGLIFNYQEVFLKDDLHETIFVLPFFGRRWSRTNNLSSSTLLWPFFSWGYNKKRGSFEINFPWPLFQLQDSRNPYIKKRIFFPFYGLYEFRKQRSFFITPFYFTLTRHTKNFISEYYFYAIICWYLKRDYIKEPSETYGSSWRYFKLWPFIQIESDDRGNYSLNILSLLFWRDPDGWEKLYQPFWTLFEYRTLQSGEKRLGILLRTYFQRWSDDFLYIKIPILFSYGSEGGDLVELSFLLSMFGYTDEEDGTYLRLLWIPIRIGEGSEVRQEAHDAQPDRPLNGYRPYRGDDQYLDSVSEKNKFVLYSTNFF